MKGILIMIMVAVTLAETCAFGQEKPDRGIAGLQFLQTKEEVQKLIPALGEKREVQFLEVYLPPELPGAPEGYKKGAMLAFCEGKLVKLILFSERTVKDIYGTAGKEGFSEMRRVLGEKYSLVKETDRQVSGTKVYKEPYEFYECLNFPGCGLWMSAFKGPDRHITLDLMGVSSGVGYVMISIEAVPEFREHRDRGKEQERKNTKEAL